MAFTAAFVAWLSSYACEKAHARDMRLIAGVCGLVGAAVLVVRAQWLWNRDATKPDGFRKDECRC